MEKLELREREATRIPAMALGPLPEAVPAAEAEAGACCLACGTVLRGEFCHGCGAPRAGAEDLTLRRMARMAATEATDLDSRVLATLRHLLFRPGFLTAEFVRGVRGAYVGPVRLFVWAYAAAVLVYSIPGLQPYLSPAGGPLGPQQEEAVRAIVAARRIPAAMAGELLEAQAQTYATWLSGLIILGFALAVLLLHLRSHRPFGVHAVFSLHFGAFNYLVGLALVPALVLASFAPAVGGLVVTLGVWGVTATYMYRAVRRVYGLGRLVSAAKTLVLVVAFTASQLAVSALAYVLARAALT